MSTGDVHEGLNLAGVWKVPAVFVVQSNRYAYSTPTERQMVNTNIAERHQRRLVRSPASGSTAPTRFAVFEVVRDAVERARAGEGPQAVEALTLRGHGHAAHDDALVRPRRASSALRATRSSDSRRDSRLDGLSDDEVEAASRGGRRRGGCGARGGRGRACAGPGDARGRRLREPTPGPEEQPMIDFSPTPEATALAERTRTFVRDVVIPAEAREGGRGLDDGLRAELPGGGRAAPGSVAPHVRRARTAGTASTSAARRDVFEAAGYSLLGPHALNCAAPDEGNMHLLEEIATGEQKERYLRPLAAGRVALLLRDDRAATRRGLRPVDAADDRASASTAAG